MLDGVSVRTRANEFRTQTRTQTRQLSAHIRQRSLSAQIGFYLCEREFHGCQRTYSINLGVKWSQVQILSARRERPALTSVRAGFWLLGFLADLLQWASSVPSGRELADA